MEPREPPIYCEVALPRPVLRTFVYQLPPSLREGARPGTRVRVPFGRREAIGCIDRLQGRPGRTGVKPILELLDAEPLLSDPLLRLCRWVAEYYVAPLGMVLRAALPPGLLSQTSSRSGEAPVLRQRVLRITRELPTLTARQEAFGTARRQREAYELLESLGGTAPTAQLTRRLGISSSVLRGLVQKQLAEMVVRRIARDPLAELEALNEPGKEVPLPVPTPDQADVISALRRQAARQSPGIALLRGVTGSGKTLVYLELMETLVRGEGRSALLLVPEISLTPQTVRRLRARFGETVAVLHSGLSQGERYDEWRALREGKKRVAVGARSAVFAPLIDPGLIVVDEEHEGSYKQSETPRYHARAVAAVRARLEGCLCLLGSATPSLESWARARQGAYRLCELPERVTGQPLPSVELVDLRASDALSPPGPSRGPAAATLAGVGGTGPSEAVSPGPAAERGKAATEVPGPVAPADGRGAAPRGEGRTDAPAGPPILSRRLREAVAERLARDEQVILFLNRRGYATFVQCEACGKVWSCARCSVSLTFHRRRRRLVCHHCGLEAEPPRRCDDCGATHLSYTGLGTEQVERRLGELFPEARIARMDLDTTGTKWAHLEILERVRRGEVDVLLGTQMIAKGLDFPAVTLVGVINADVGLNLPDFRATERTFQLLAQVAGRAGRGSRPGQVLVQTYRPHHFALLAAVEHDYLAFAEREMRDRTEAGYPPLRRLANLVVSGAPEARVAEAAIDLAEWTRGLLRDRELGGIEVVGPAPCPIERLRGRWRWHFLLKADAAGTLGSVLRYVADRQGVVTGRMRLEVDRDPEALM
ncbi:MAG: primosomal protein N' [Gemmatimonadota bacterium]